MQARLLCEGSDETVLSRMRHSPGLVQGRSGLRDAV